MTSMRRRTIWDWHFWLGLTLALPLLWWMGTAMVFAIWPIDHVRGRTLSTGVKAPMADLTGVRLPEWLLDGAQHVTLQAVEGHPVAIVHRGKSVQVVDLVSGSMVGSVIPVGWAVEAARRDFRGSFSPAEILLFDEEGRGRRLDAPDMAIRPLPSEYAGPLPVYAFHLDQGPSLHLYVDAHTGEVRARRSGIWRFYDWCFRLHSLEFTSDGTKRGLMLVICGLWFVLGGTGMYMAWRTRKGRFGSRG